MKSPIKDKPQIEFIVSLHKIKDIYNKYEDLNERYPFQDISSKIDYYNTKKSFSDEDLQKLQWNCEYQWKTILTKICNIIIEKCENKKKLFPKELKEANMIKQKIENNSLKLGDYESIFTDELEKLKEDFDSKLEREKIEWKRFWWGLFLGLILGIGGTILLRILKIT